MGYLRSVVLGTFVLAALASTAQAQTRGGFDGNGRLLMHGAPRFVLGVYDSDGGYSSDPGFDSYIFAGTSSPNAVSLIITTTVTLPAPSSTV